MQFTPGSNAEVIPGRDGFKLNIRQQVPGPQPAGTKRAAVTGNYYGPAGVTNWATPGAPLDTEIESALLANYTGPPAETPTLGDTIQLWPTSAGYLSVLCICLGVHGTTGVSRFIHITISAVQYDFFVAGATST